MIEFKKFIHLIIFVLLFGCMPQNQSTQERGIENNQFILNPHQNTNTEISTTAIPNTSEQTLTITSENRPTVVLPPCRSNSQFLSGEGCGFSYSTRYTSASSLHCRLYYQFPHTQSNQAPVQKIDFYTNCGSCQEAALKYHNGRTSIEAPVGIVSGKRCELSKLKWNLQYKARFSFWVDTLNESSCKLSRIYFYFPSRLYGQLNKTSEKDGCI